MVNLPKLTKEDNARVKLEATRFQDDSEARGVRDSLYGKTRDGHIATTIKGFNGEVLFSRWSGIPWEPEPGAFKAGPADFPPDIEVRTVYPKQGGGAPSHPYLKVTPRDVQVNPRRRFYAISHENGQPFQLVGWCFADETDGMGTINPNGWGAMFAVHPKDLHRISCKRGVQPIEEAT